MSIPALLWSVLAWVPVVQDGYREADLGLIFARPGPEWHEAGAEEAAGGGYEYKFRHADHEARTINLIVWELDREFVLTELLDSELSQQEARGHVEEFDREPREVAGRPAHALRYRLERDDEGPVVVDATYFQTEVFLGRVGVTFPADDHGEEMDEAVAAALAAVELGAAASIEGQPIDFGPPDPDHVLTLVHGADPSERFYAYLEALPGAALASDGLPLVLAAGPTLGDAARAFLAKYRPGTIRRVGPPHPELPGSVVAVDEWPEDGTVVVAPRRAAPAIQAACLATRLGAPLVLDGDDLNRRLQVLRPRRVLAFGAVAVPGRDHVEVIAVNGPAHAARLAGGADYIALCNVAAPEGKETAALAAALAALRGGVVLPLEFSTTRHRIPLEVTEECPPGLEPDAEHYLVADIHTANGTVKAGAAMTGEVRVASSGSPRYERLRIDLDRDGELEPDEVPRIGESVAFGDSDFRLTYHYGHPFIGYVRSELVLQEADPARIRSTIRELARELGGVEHLALIGTPDHIPFCYTEASGYFEAFDIKQELPSDAPYANLDEDSYLELAVGRLPVETLTEGSAKIATTVAYERLKGDWADRATMIQPGFHELEGSLPWVLPNAEAMIRGIGGDLATAGLDVRGFYRSDVVMDDVLEAMSGSAWIAYFNHSGPGSWGIHPGASIVTRKTRGKKNRSLPPLHGAPVVFGGGCSSAALDVGQPLTATFPGRLFELGAVSYLGNTRVAYARSEHLVQLYFARLASGDASLGQAYRDARNFLAHLLDEGHLVGHIDYGVELGERDFLRGQYRILNLFGDPALRPRLPDGVSSPLQVDWQDTDEPDRRRLVVRHDGDVRHDPVLMMPATGQGKPREFLVQTSAGLTTSHLPYNFVENGLSPVRSIPEIQPGAWVDVALPTGARDVEVTRVSGLPWADRGFRVVDGPRGEPRLLMYVPLVRSTLERGEGAFLDEVAFDVTFGSAAADVASPVIPQSSPRVQVVDAWQPGHTGETRYGEGARDLVALVEETHEGTAPPAVQRIEWKLKNPQPRLYGDEAHFIGRWREEGAAQLEAVALPHFLEARRPAVERAAEDAAGLAFQSPLPPLEGMQVTAASESVLVLRPVVDDGGEKRTEVHLAEEGTVERLVERQFGVTTETHYTWRSSDQGPLLERRVVFDRTQPDDPIVHEIAYVRSGDLWLPQRVTLRLVGVLPRDFHYDFEYLDAPP